LFNPDLQKWLHRIHVPTQVIWGDHDGLFPLAYAQHWHQQLPASALHIVPDCGHSPINEKPAETAALIHAFMAQNPA
jgi:pimeloyl-ACP methyl ester carboxylesterase